MKTVAKKRESTDRALDEREENQLWRTYRDTRSPEIRDRLIRQYAPLVKYVAGKVAVGMPATVEFDDLVGCGVFGLFDAIEKYDPDKHVKFKTYAVTRIRGAILDELRSMDWVPRTVRQKSRELDETVRDLEANLGRSASDREIADAMGTSVKEFEKMLVKISSTTIMSLNEVWYAGDEHESISVADTIESPVSLNPDTIVERDEIRRVIVEAIKELPEKEKKVLVLYYYEDLTLKEIGQVLDVTESRISQLHTRAIMRLRAKLSGLKRGIV